jgi:hypothetical protein
MDGQNHYVKASRKQDSHRAVFVLLFQCTPSEKQEEIVLDMPHRAICFWFGLFEAKNEDAKAAIEEIRPALFYLSSCPIIPYYISTGLLQNPGSSK